MIRIDTKEGIIRECKIMGTIVDLSVDLCTIARLIYDKMNDGGEDDKECAEFFKDFIKDEFYNSVFEKFEKHDCKCEKREEADKLVKDLIDHAKKVMNELEEMNKE